MTKPKIKIGISYILFFLCCLLFKQLALVFNYTFALILHEMAHYYVARNKGYKVNNIKLDLLGMKLVISENIDKNDRFWIAFAGPALNFLLCVVCCAMWWIVPESFYFSSTFFQANLMIAIFNILPIQPLDGGMMLNSLLSKLNRKKANLISTIINVVFIVGFLVLFVISCDTTPTFILLIFAVFFILNLVSTKKLNEYDLYYKRLLKRNMSVTKINLLKIDGDTSLLECYKNIKENNYTVFFYQGKRTHYITEMDLQQLITKYNLTTKIKDAVE